LIPKSRTGPDTDTRHYGLHDVSWHAAIWRLATRGTDCDSTSTALPRCTCSSLPGIDHTPSLREDGASDALLAASHLHCQLRLLIACVERKVLGMLMCLAVCGIPTRQQQATCTRVEYSGWRVARKGGVRHLHPARDRRDPNPTEKLLHSRL